MGTGYLHGCTADEFCACSTVFVKNDVISVDQMQTALLYSMSKKP